MNRKGFTLIELLAVVAILAILAIIALPNILELYKSTRKNTFLSEVQSVYDSTKKKYMLNQFNGSNTSEVYTNTDENKKLDIQGGTGGSDFKYCVTVNENGEITSISVTNGTYKYESNSVMDNADIINVSEIDSTYSFECDTSVAGGGNSTRYLYTVGNYEPSIGSTLTVNNTTVFEDYVSASNAYYYHVLLTHLVDSNNVILESYASYIKDGSIYHLKGASASSYNDNKNILISIFGSSNCGEHTYTQYTGFSCHTGDVDGPFGEIRSNGYARFGPDHTFCFVDADGHSECRTLIVSFP